MKSRAEQHSSTPRRVTEALGELAALDFPGATGVDRGCYVGGFTKKLIPVRRTIHDAEALGIAEPEKPFILIPRQPYRYGWLIPGAVEIEDNKVLVTDAGEVYKQYAHIPDEPAIVGLNPESWNDDISQEVVADWLNDLADKTTIEREFLRNARGPVGTPPLFTPHTRTA